MLCRRPYMLGVMECPCGACLPCRINRRRIWAHRILLESYKHGDSCFVTLTYNNEHCPSELVKSDYRNWLKRLRRAIFPRKIRYFLAGEYGELTGRPHFHAAVFGLDVVTAGGLDGQGGAVQDAWIVGRKADRSFDGSSLGFTSVGCLNWESAQYIAGYLTKKVVADERSVREFSRMSLRPGIGKSAMGDVARALASDTGLDKVFHDGDVPYLLRHGKRLLPLGRYLRRELRGELGFASKDTPAEAGRLQVLRKAVEVAEARRDAAKEGFKSWLIDEKLLDERYQKIKNIEARFRLRDSERKLK